MTYSRELSLLGGVFGEFSDITRWMKILGAQRVDGGRRERRFCYATRWEARVTRETLDVRRV